MSDCTIMSAEARGNVFFKCLNLTLDYWTDALPTPQFHHTAIWPNRMENAVLNQSVILPHNKEASQELDQLVGKELVRWQLILLVFPLAFEKGRVFFLSGHS